jgi:glucose-1-phosphate thymidylyltransferase
MHLAYLMMGLPFGTPYSLDQAHPFVQNTLVAFGFPDILFQGDDVFVKLLDHQAATGADVVLGLFPVKEPKTMDMVETDDNGVVNSIVIQPRQTRLQFGWIIAVWTPTFTRFLHKHLQLIQNEEYGLSRKLPSKHEVSVGHVFREALDKGLKLQSVAFTGHKYLDIGTPANLAKAIRDARFNMDH